MTIARTRKNNLKAENNGRSVDPGIRKKGFIARSFEFFRWGGMASCGSCFQHGLFSLIMIGRRAAWPANGKLNPRKTAAYRVSRACHTPMVLNPGSLCAGRVWKLKFFQGKIDVTIGTAGSDGGNIVLQDDYVTMDMSSGCICISIPKRRI